ncbi:bifunctional lysylphosphatidylglycerol flippase/synthetase MprF [Novosphingobium aerophilum]|uniref:bifunctional lysylphosphatidylglycerol flippase/synthetase MprF n=1 Tax=Novosphingobium TaxID=165696 RepID=UPI002D76C3E6|nr:bifunctional lysylphosphatidylglycerol flippase/synthetase MprF [Novosphingobium sp. RL4]WRT95610.1 bifunctional lysylphosphatidylglycerol flippase/synthetase MprF [Novosphingobium sp. RL4]
MDAPAVNAHLKSLAARLAVPAQLAVAALVLGLAALCLHRLATSLDIHAVLRTARAIPGWRLAAAFALTAGSYLLLTAYDVMALRTIGRPLPYRTAALASFTSYTLSHNLGFGILTGAAARLRIYGAKGLGTGEVARVTAIAGVTFWTGVFASASLALLVHRRPLAVAGHVVSMGAQHAAGAGLLALLVGATLMARRWHLPRPAAIARMTLVALADIAAACGTLYVLLPHLAIALYPPLLLAYVLAIVVALVSHVPGGLGVFEATVVALCPQIPPGELLAALLVYRIVYYLLPLALALVLLVRHEHARWRRPAALAARAAETMIVGLAPRVIALLVFFGGAILLLSGTTPALPERMAAIRGVVPLPFVEASQIAASLVGTTLLLLAPALYRRLDAAFLLTRALLLAGACFSLAKGLDYEEALTLLAVAGVLQLARKGFWRRTALTTDVMSVNWIMAMVATIALMIVIGYFTQTFPAYRSSLWWKFAWSGDASRYMRTSFAVAVLTGAFVLLAFLRPSRHAVQPGDAPVDVAQALTHAVRSEAMLALTGDKLFLAGPDSRSMLMYQVQGHSWIVMGDPVGDPSDWPELLWRLRERADANQGRVLLYQVTPAVLPIAIDMGLQLMKYGEEARVPLAEFGLDGPAARPLRHAMRRAEREGAEFAIVPAARTGAIMGELRAVSDAWLHAKGQREKAFSVGRFEADYIARCDIAVVRCEGRIVAFANLWKTAGREELSVDLMRHCAEVPYGCMDFLFTRLMLWGRQEGYQWFNLGLAPLSGIEARRLAPTWARAAGMLFRHGEAFYGFEGLRNYKEKFCPVWEPRFIACNGGMATGRALLDLQSLIADGKGSAARQQARLRLRDAEKLQLA